jgi:hypothetical protein
MICGVAESEGEQGAHRVYWATEKTNANMLAYKLIREGTSNFDWSLF